MLHNKMKNQNKDKHDTYGIFGFTLLKSKEFTPAEKLIAQYMLHRYKFFSKDGGKYYDTQSAIGEACGIDKRTVTRSITKLVDAGLLLSNKAIGKAGRNNVYIVFDFISNPRGRFGNQSLSIKDEETVDVDNGTPWWQDLDENGEIVEPF